jgi:hypothetical protein
VLAQTELANAHTRTPARVAALALSCLTHELGIARVEAVGRTTSSLHVAISAHTLVVDSRDSRLLSQQCDCLILRLHDLLQRLALLVGQARQPAKRGGIEFELGKQVRRKQVIEQLLVHLHQCLFDGHV